MRIITLTVFLLVLSAASHANSNNRVWVEGNVIYYVGELTRVLNNQVFRLFKENKTINLIAIQSRGGDAYVGLELGSFIYSNGLSVRVDSHCMSACANYVFTAGSVKYVNINSLIAFHGGLTSESIIDDALLEQLPISGREQIINKFKSDQKKLVIREKEFFDSIGVQLKITTLGETNRFLASWEAGYVGWYYTEGSLKKLGVKNIVLIDGKWEPMKSLNDLKFFRITEEDVI